MLLVLVFLLFVVGVALIFFMPALWGREIYRHYSAPRAVTCPETHQQVAVSLDARHAAVTGLRGNPEFRLSDCTRWPERGGCGRECLPEAVRNPAYTAGEVQPSRARRQIYHLPVLLAAFAAWYAGAWWHSQFLFRARWMEALGLTRDQLRLLVHWPAPHLLSIFACVLFAYGVAWLLTRFAHRGVWQGILSSVTLWAALLIVSLPLLLGLSRDFVLIETGYSLIATALVGVIIGGLSGKLVLPVLET